MRRRPLIAALVVTVVISGAAPSVWADDGADAFVDNDGDPTAVAKDVEVREVPAAGTGEDQCRWRVVIGDDFEFAIYDVDFTRLHSETGRWLEYWCPDQGIVPINGFALVPEGGAVDPSQLAVDALASVGIDGPTFHTSPSENGRLYVGVPTWLWVEQGWWRPYEATARAGRVWSTVRATPVATTWDTGDGDRVDCRGPGTAWRPGMPEGASDCTHTYRRSSATTPQGTFRLQPTVTLEISWTSNAPGAGGSLPPISRTSFRDVEVGEIQAIGTRGA